MYLTQIFAAHSTLYIDFFSFYFKKSEKILPRQLGHEILTHKKSSIYAKPQYFPRQILELEAQL